MTMLEEHELQQLIGYDVVDENGKSVGNVELIFNDDETGRPEWVGVLSGTFRQYRVLVPAAGAEKHGPSLRLPWAKERIKRAPRYDQEDRGGLLGLGGYQTTISKEKERDAYAYYGLEQPAATGARS